MNFYCGLLFCDLVLEEHNETIHCFKVTSRHRKTDAADNNIMTIMQILIKCFSIFVYKTTDSGNNVCGMFADCESP